jgi:hypothetical protein
MRGRTSRNRTNVLFATVVLVAAVALVVALAFVGEAQIGSIPAPSIAVFGTFLTSMSIIAAFSIEATSRWPTPWEVLDRAHVPAWFAVALASVVTALVAGLFDCDFLGTFSLVLAIAALPLGARGLRGLIWCSSEQGRRELVVDLLADSVLKSGPIGRGGPADLDEIKTEDHVPAGFRDLGRLREPGQTGVTIEQVPRVLCEYADRRDLESIVRLISEVHAGAGEALKLRPVEDVDRYLNSVEAVLFTQRTMVRELAERVLSGQLGEAAAGVAVLRAGETVLHLGGCARHPAGLGKGERDQIERLVCRHVVALARFAGGLTQEIDSRIALQGAQGSGAERRAELALRATAVELQQAVRWALDPEPPGMKLPAPHPWRRGLTLAEPVPVWLWSTVESASGPFGVALYASCQILTGEKFWESYWDGFDVFTEVSKRLEASERPEAVAAASVIDRCGGLELMALELGAARLAAMPPRRPGGRAFEHDPADLDKRHIACNLFLAAAGFKPPGRDPVLDLAHLLTDRTSGDLWTTVLEDLRLLPDETVPPPLQPLYRRPESAAFAVCLRLVPLEERPGEEALAAAKRFASLLPQPLLEATANLAVGLTEGGRCDGDRSDLEERLIEAARFARWIAPGELPSQEAKGQPSMPPSAPAPTELRGRGFERALEELSEPGPVLRVDLVQCNPRWLGEWSDLRAALDTALLAGALRGRLQVRRLVLYDLPGDPAPAATRLHYRWTESLASAVRCFPRTRAKPSPYQVRQVLADRLGSSEDLGADYVAVWPSENTVGTPFDALWTDGERGLIEL